MRRAAHTLKSTSAMLGATASRPSRRPREPARADETTATAVAELDAAADDTTDFTEILTTLEHP